MATRRDPELGARDSASVGRDVASITRAKMARRQQRRPYVASEASSVPLNVDTSQGTSTKGYTGPPPPPPPPFLDSGLGWAEIPSLLSNASNDTYDTMDQNTMETNLFKKFEEAFNITLRNNPGILPGAPTVIESIKTAMFKVQKSKAIREVEMRTELDRLKVEVSNMEQQLSQQIGTTNVRKSELIKQLEHESLTTQLEAMEVVSNDLKKKLEGASKEKKEMVKHLDLLSKSRKELEKNLENEVKIVEKEKEALQAIIKERKKLEKQRDENKLLEDKVEKLTEEASKEKKALQEEVEEHKKFMEHIQTLRDQNEVAKQQFEKEKKELLECTQSIQAKKMALIESKEDLERQHQVEIHELESQLAESKIAHVNKKESIVKNQVMSYLKKNDKDNENMRIEAIVNARVEKEMKKKARILVDDFSDDELLDELASRNLTQGTVQDLVEKIYHKRRLSQNFDDELDKLIYAILGRV